MLKISEKLLNIIIELHITVIYSLLKLVNNHFSNLGTKLVTILKLDANFKMELQHIESVKIMFHLVKHWVVGHQRLVEKPGVLVTLQVGEHQGDLFERV